MISFAIGYVLGVIAILNLTKCNIERCAMGLIWSFGYPVVVAIGFIVYGDLT